MRLEIGRLIGHHSTRRRRVFVESIASEFLQQIENFVGLSLGMLLVSLQPATKLFRCLAISSSFFLPMARLAIRTTERVTSQQLRGLHYLLLINENAVGLFGNLFE